MVWRHRHTSYGLGVTGDCAWLSRAKETIEASHKLRQWLVQRQQDSVSLIGHLWKQLASLDATKLCRGKEGCHLENHLDNYSSSLKCHAFLKAMWSWFCCDVRKKSSVFTGLSRWCDRWYTVWCCVAKYFIPLASASYIHCVYMMQKARGVSQWNLRLVGERILYNSTGREALLLLQVNGNVKITSFSSV